MKIGELAKKAGVNVETIRYYQRLDLLNKPENMTGFRQYSAHHLNEVRFIQSAKTAGFSLKEILHLKQLDSIKDRDRILAMAEKKQYELARTMEELLEAKVFLDSLIEKCKTNESDACPIKERFRQHSS